ncbi:MAG: virulence RhuM family protein [Bacteroidales bacterium]|nr:virulence RhuM family protein [Bacteroidales bacterium]
MNDILSAKGEVAVFNPDETIRLEVRVGDETVWLTRMQMASLFSRDVKTIGKHIDNALNEELKDMSTVAKFATVQQEGGRKVTRMVEYYNLEMVISVGFRVKSSRGVQFRRWANSILKDCLTRGYAIGRRLEELERRTTVNEERIIYDGQIFDAYVFACDLIKSAKRSVVLIDNYVDDSILHILAKRRAGVTASIYTSNKSSMSCLDIQKYNAQYAPIDILSINNVHDRFLIIDDDIYHLGASLKDLGKKVFAFSRLDSVGIEKLLKIIAPHP